MVQPFFHGNSLVADTSSLIYLAKSSIIDLFLRAFHVTVPPSVYQECVHEGYPGSDQIRKLQQGGHLTVHPVGEEPTIRLELPKGGERDAIILYYQLGSDGILIDDRVGVRTCRNRGIPFVSALLVPSLLLMRKAVNLKEAEASLEKIIEMGRYSEEVIFFARTVFWGQAACSLETPEDLATQNHSSASSLRTGPADLEVGG